MPSDPISSPHPTQNLAWKIVIEFSLPNQPGSDRLASERVAAALNELRLPAVIIERLQSTIAEATVKAIEPGSYFEPGQPIRIRVLMLEQAILGRVWGFFLIHKTEEQGQTHLAEGCYLIELYLYRENDLEQPSRPTTGGVP